MFRKSITISPNYKPQYSFKPLILKRSVGKKNVVFHSSTSLVHIQTRMFAFLVNPNKVTSVQAKKHDKPPLPIIKHEGTIFVGHEIKQPEDLIAQHREEKKKKLKKQLENQVPFSKLTEEQKNQIRQLRTADPIKYSSSVLQKMFNISSVTVAQVARCPDWRKQQLLEELSLTPIERKKRANIEKKNNLKEWVKQQQSREAIIKLSRTGKRVKGLNFAQLLDNMVIVDKQNKKKNKAAQKSAETVTNTATQQKS